MNTGNAFRAQGQKCQNLTPLHDFANDFQNTPDCGTVLIQNIQDFSSENSFSAIPKQVKMVIHFPFSCRTQDLLRMVSQSGWGLGCGPSTLLPSEPQRPCALGWMVLFSHTFLDYILLRSKRVWLCRVRGLRDWN